MSMYIIGNDQGLLNAPVEVKNLLIAPAERYDILINFAGLKIGERVDLLNSNIPAEAPPESQISTLMQFRRTWGHTFRQKIPTVLRDNNNRWKPNKLPEVASINTTGVPVRRFTLSEGPRVDYPELNQLLVNNLPYGIPDAQREAVPQGSTEIWEFINPMPEAHPMHIHLVPHRIISRQALDVGGLTAAYPIPSTPGIKWEPNPDGFVGAAVPPAAYESGSKDTVIVPAQSVVRVLLRFPAQSELGFDPTARFISVDGTKELGGYMVHCHILEHEDNDMMQTFNIV